MPDATAWPKLQALRVAHDRQVHIWPPHINLLYPFVSEGEFEAVAQTLAEATASLPSLRLRFRRLGHFGGTAFLIPECDQDSGLSKLYEACVSAMPSGFPAPRRDFMPHLTIGQFKNVAACEDFIRGCPPIEIETEISCLSLLSRQTMKHAFRTPWLVGLGEGEKGIRQGDSLPYSCGARVDSANHSRCSPPRHDGGHPRPVLLGAKLAVSAEKCDVGNDLQKHMVPKVLVATEDESAWPALSAAPARRRQGRPSPMLMNLHT